MEVKVTKNYVGVLNPDFNSATFWGAVEDYMCLKLDSFIVMDRGEEMTFMSCHIASSIEKSVRLSREDHTFNETAFNDDVEQFPNAEDDDIFIDDTTLEVEFCHLILDMARYCDKHIKDFMKFQEETLDT